ncbi:MAG: sulfurtransferase complex subunit TusB [Methyloprofundus sp.]|nr:sulfurtransferase complex subunit TusB [Methyloprofundus sp.]
MLYLVFSKNHAGQALEFVTDGDAVLYMDSSTLSLLNQSDFSERLRKMADNVSFYALSSDLQLRGIAETELSECISVIDYSRFVELTLEHSVIKTWN